MVNHPNWRLPEVPEFTLVSPDFQDGGTLPQWARSAAADECGEDRSPTLHWEGAPSGTRSFALTMFDPDAPTGSGWWHWGVYNIPAKVSSLPAGAGDPANDRLPAGALMTHNELREQRYQGAAPPPGHGEHRYFFTLSALDVERLELPADATTAILGFHIAQHIVGRAQLVGVSETP